MQKSELLYFGGNVMGAMGSTNSESSSKSISGGTSQSAALYFTSGTVSLSSCVILLLLSPPEPTSPAQLQSHPLPNQKKARASGTSEKGTATACRALTACPSSSCSDALTQGTE